VQETNRRQRETFANKVIDYFADRHDLTTLHVGDCEIVPAAWLSANVRSTTGRRLDAIKPHGGHNRRILVLSVIRRSSKDEPRR